MKRSDQFKEVIQTQKQKPATYQKKINEMFPTLGGGDPEPKEEPKKEVNKIEAPKQEGKKEQKAWWEKINQPKKVEIDEEEGPKVRNRKGKKEKWVSAKGMFN